MASKLSVVSDNTANGSVSQRIQRLQSEAKILAREHTAAFIASLHETMNLASEIAEGGEAYPAGIRDIARRLVEDLDTKTQTIQAIAVRA